MAEFFEKLHEGQAPSTFNREFLKDLGFASSNWHAFSSLLKGLGFLSADGTPTSKYMDFLDKTRWKTVLGEAVKDAYSDVFVLKSNPTAGDLGMISGKYKSTYNMSDTSADRAARTFLALYELSDKSVFTATKRAESKTVPETVVENPAPDEPRIEPSKVEKEIPVFDQSKAKTVGLNYNIQIHLPATKDIEVYNAIFKSLREHIIE